MDCIEPDIFRLGLEGKNKAFLVTNDGQFMKCASAAAFTDLNVPGIERGLNTLNAPPANPNNVHGVARPRLEEKYIWQITMDMWGFRLALGCTVCKDVLFSCYENLLQAITLAILVLMLCYPS